MTKYERNFYAIMVMKSAMMNDSFTEEQELFNEDDFITQVLRKRLKAFGINIKIPVWLGVVISVCTESNPGLSLIIFKDFLTSVNNNRFNGEGINEDYEFTFLDFILAFKTFPVDIEYYSDKYDKQKVDEYNLCDTFDYWAECFYTK